MLTKRTLLVLFTLFLWGMVQGQLFLPKRCYMHLTGTSHDTLEIGINLVKVYDSVYADVILKEDSIALYTLGGFINADGSFQMYDPFGDSAIGLTGQFVTRKTLSATFTDENRKKEVEVDLIENYPDGSLPLMVYFDKDSLAVTENGSTAHAMIQQSMILPGTSASPVISDTLRQSMSINYLAEKPGVMKTAEMLMKERKKQFMVNFEESTIPLLKSFPDAGNVNWILLKFMHILHNGNDLVSCYTWNYGYTGGAHGLETEEHSVISIKDGKPLRLNDLFISGYTETLSKSLTSKLKEMLGLDPDANLTDHGFYEDDIPPSNNFYVIREGIGFYYNHYEIAPYVNGPTDIFIPFSELAPIINQEGIIGTSFSNK